MTSLFETTANSIQNINSFLDNDKRVSSIKPIINKNESFQVNVLNLTDKLKSEIGMYAISIYRDLLRLKIASFFKNLFPIQLLKHSHNVFLKIH